MISTGMTREMFCSGGVKEIPHCLRKNDTLSRFGGDEFVIVLQDIEQPREAAVIAARIIECRHYRCILRGRR